VLLTKKVSYLLAEYSRRSQAKSQALGQEIELDERST
jgi:hypothetical protein